MAWQSMKSAPKDKHILLYGIVTGGDDSVKFTDKPMMLTGYYDMIDDAWCSTTASWNGPFIKAIAWMELPESPNG